MDDRPIPRGSGGLLHHRQGKGRFIIVDQHAAHERNPLRIRSSASVSSGCRAAVVADAEFVEVKRQWSVLLERQDAFQIPFREVACSVEEEKPLRFADQILKRYRL